MIISLKKNLYFKRQELIDKEKHITYNTHKVRNKSK